MGKSFPAIACGLRNDFHHGAAMAACGVVEDLLDTDPAFRAALRELAVQTGVAIPDRYL